MRYRDFSDTFVNFKTQNQFYVYVFKFSGFYLTIRVSPHLTPGDSPGSTSRPTPTGPSQRPDDPPLRISQLSTRSNMNVKLEENPEKPGEPEYFEIDHGKVKLYNK